MLGDVVCSRVVKSLQIILRSELDKLISLNFSHSKIHTRTLVPINQAEQGAKNKSGAAL